MIEPINKLGLAISSTTGAVLFGFAFWWLSRYIDRRDAEMKTIASCTARDGGIPIRDAAGRICCFVMPRAWWGR
jgi:hypothetical protein